MLKYKLLRFLFSLINVKYETMQHDTYRTIVWEREILDDGTIRWKRNYQLKSIK
jgi:hypothetical protein